MSQQQVFDRVVRHLFAQGKRSVDMHSNPVYCGTNGLKDPVGLLMSDYKPGDERLSVGALVQSGRLSGVSPTGTDDAHSYFGVLDDLREIHDNLSNWRTSPVMQDALRLVAVRHGLDPSVLSQVGFGDR